MTQFAAQTSPSPREIYKMNAQGLRYQILATERVSFTGSLQEYPPFFNALISKVCLPEGSSYSCVIGF